MLETKGEISVKAKHACDTSVSLAMESPKTALLRLMFAGDFAKINARLKPVSRENKFDISVCLRLPRVHLAWRYCSASVDLKATPP